MVFGYFDNWTSLSLTLVQSYNSLKHQNGVPRALTFKGSQFTRLHYGSSKSATVELVTSVTADMAMPNVSHFDVISESSSDKDEKEEEKHISLESTDLCVS